MEARTPSPLPRPVVILLNDAASSARTARVRHSVELTRRALDADLLTIATRDAEELTAFVREHAGYPTVVVAGGDGTLGVVYNALAGSDTTLGYIPAGFGNATAHLLGLPRDPDALAATIIAGDARPLDLVRVGSRIALFTGVGWDALVAGRYADGGARGTLGWAAAIGSAIPALFQRPTVRLRVDDEPVYEGPMEMCVAATTPWFGRGLLVNPGARPDAGRMRLRLYPGPVGRLAVAAVHWLAGRTSAAPHWDATHAALEVIHGGELPLQADGDRIGRASAWTFTLEPRAVRLIGRWSSRRP
jgi:diacylglycerol kinase family enzyme